MRSFLSAITLLFLFSNVLAQITIAGKIKLTPSWRQTLYIFSVERFDFNQKMIDSITLDPEGNFHYRIDRVDPKRIVYKLAIPPRGDDPHRSLDGYSENNIFLVLNDRDSCFVLADADSLYYSSKLSGSPINKEPALIQQYKKPFYELTLRAAKEIKSNPTNNEQVLREMEPIWLKFIDTLRTQLINYIDRSESPGGKLLGLYNLYIAGFGEIDSVYAGTVISNSNLKDYYLTDGIRQAIKSSENNRLGKVLPDVALFDSSGKGRNLYSLLKEVTIIDFWGGFCGPCRKANRNELRQLFSRIKNTDTALIAISVDSESNKWLTALREDSTTWPSYIEQIDHKFLSKTIGISAVPVYIVIDMNRSVIYHGSSILHLMSFLSRTNR